MSEVKERPILFSGAMVRALLAGEKTQTRRIVKPQPEYAQVHEWRGTVIRDCESRAWCWKGYDFGDGDPVAATPGDGIIPHCPYGVVGDRLWVRESFQTRRWGGIGDSTTPGTIRLMYDAAVDRFDHTAFFESGSDCVYLRSDSWKRHPSIFMQRVFSRITLEITDVRCERLQDITEADARAEGITDGGCLNCGNPEPCNCAAPAPDAVDAFVHGWNVLNGKRAWESNPWVFVISFRRII